MRGKKSLRHHFAARETSRKTRLVILTPTDLSRASLEMAGQPRSPAAPLPGPSRPSRALPSPSHHPQPHFQPHPHPYQHQLQQQQHTHTQPQPPTRRSAIPSFSRPQQPLGGGGAGWSTSRDALDLPGLSGGEDDGDDNQVGDSDGWTSDDEDEGFGSFAGKGAGGLLGRGRKDPFGAASGHARSSIGISGARYVLPVTFTREPTHPWIFPCPLLLAAIPRQSLTPRPPLCVPSSTHRWSSTRRRTTSSLRRRMARG